LIGSRSEALGPLIAGTTIATQRPALPADAAQLLVLTCVYQSGANQVTRHYWPGTAPAWQRAIPAGHPLNQLVLGTESQCPAALRESAVVATAIVTTAPAATPSVERQSIPLPSFELGRNDFKAGGLEYEGAFTSLYLGNFSNMPFERDRPEMSAMMGAYIDVFGKGCREFLPPNRVEVTEEKCVAWTETRNGFGTLVNTTCNRTVPVGTGVFADPAVYSARLGLQRLANTHALADVLSIFQGGLSGVADQVQVVRSVKSDVEDLVKLNGCGSRALHRFQDNMRLFAENKQPILISNDGGTATPSVTPATPPRPVKAQDFSKMLDDLVGINSRSWAINRYQRGSMSAKVASQDAQGRPRRVQGTYAYEGFAGRATGTVALEFSDGAPQCLYFWDFPTACRTPDRGVSTEYANGAYATRE
jgi:hypothetical protein